MVFQSNSYLMVLFQPILKHFLFTIYALTELSLLVLNNQIIGTGQDLKKRMCDLSM